MHSIGVARGGGGEWDGGPSPPPCGQLTRCFSVVAKLLVFFTLHYIRSIRSALTGIV